MHIAGQVVEVVETALAREPGHARFEDRQSRPLASPVTDNLAEDRQVEDVVLLLKNVFLYLLDHFVPVLPSIAVHVLDVDPQKTLGREVVVKLKVKAS